MNPEAAQQLRDLETVLEVTRALGATTDLDALLGAIERATREVLRCERATVFLYDAGANQLVSRIATGVREIRFPADKGIAGHVVRTGQVVNVRDAYADERFNPEIDRQTGFRTRTILAVPLYDYSGQLMGVAQALNKLEGCFEDYDAWLAAALSAQAGVALQRQRLLEQYAAKQKMQRDMEVARSIQQAILPKEPPRVPGFEIAGWNRSADETGGDYFDFFVRPDGSAAVSVADATGHGIGPALVMTECRALLRACMTDGGDLTAAMARVNGLLCEDLPAGRFVTVFLSLVRPDHDEIPYVAAGHGPALVIRGDGKIEQYGSTAVPLGILSELEFEQCEPIRLRAGDLLAVATDGMFEWQNGLGEPFGIERLADALRRFRALPASQIIEKVYGELCGFIGECPQSDDLTAIVIKRV